MASIQYKTCISKVCKHRAQGAGFDWRNGMFMRLTSGAKRFWRDESGNTTVDWVVLISGILGMTFIVMGSISGGVSIFGDKAGDELATREVGRF